MHILVNQCENCESKVSEFWCDICSSCLCLQCFDTIHNIKVLRQQNKIPINERSTSSNICPQHKRKVLEYWCANDESFLCQDCCMTEHNKHFIKTIDEAARQKVDEVRSYTVYFFMENSKISACFSLNG